MMALFAFFIGQRRESLKIKVHEEALACLRYAAGKMFCDKSEELMILRKISPPAMRQSMRKVKNSRGTFTVEIDDRKEKQSLYSLSETGVKVGRLYRTGQFSLDSLLAQWRQELEKAGIDSRCALKLNVVLLEDSLSRLSCVGEPTVCKDEYALGSYYLDSMYTMVLTPYYKVGIFVGSANFTVVGTMLVFVVMVFAFGAGYVFAADGRQTKEIMKVPFSDILQIGNYRFDRWKCILSCDNKEILCTVQESRLIYAFITAPDYTLSKNEICRVCGWGADDRAVDERIRKAVSEVRKLFADGSVQIKPQKGKGKYQMIIKS